MNILNLKIPTLLVEAIDANQWVAPPVDSSFYSVFPDRPLNPFFFLNLENSYFKNISEYENTADQSTLWWIGQNLPNCTPGKVDPYKLIEIGAIATDCMFGLYYKTDNKNPSVIYLNNALCWVTISEDFNVFMQHYQKYI